MKFRTQRLLLSASVAALAVGGLLAGEARAQDAGQTDQAQLEAVVVTAQRREANLQDAAAAISALSGEQLSARGMSDIQDVGALNPALQVSIYQGESSVFVRGIGTPIIVGGSESSTSTYLDGVYVARPAAAAVAFFDLADVQILRGPQGTLYGRNATGGSVLLNSRGPSETFQGELRLTLGDYNRKALFGAVSAPLSDRLSARLALQLEDRDGYTTVRRPGGGSTDVENKRDLTARLSVRFQATDDLTLDGTLDYYRARDRAQVFQYVGRGYADLLPTPTDYYSLFPIIQPWLAYNAPGRQSPALSRNEFGDLNYFNRPEIWGATVKATFDIGGVRLSAITGYRSTRTRFKDDIDLTDAFASSITRGERHWQFTEDLQVEFDIGDRFSAVVGASYLKEENRLKNEFDGPFFPALLQGYSALYPFLGIPAVGYAADCCQLRLNGDTGAEALSAFVDGRLKITDRFSLAAGVRYSHERRTGAQEFGVFGSPVPDALLGALGFYNVTPLQPVEFNAATPHVSLEYQATDDVFLYASANRGFKAGGFNIGSPQNDAFNPEKIWSYEFGAKTELFERRLRLNLAAFYYDYTDLQVQDSVGQSTIIRNTGSAKIKGLELEVLARPIPGLEIEASFGWLDATFDSFNLIEPNRPVAYNPFTPGVGPTVVDLLTKGSKVSSYSPNYGLVPVGAPVGFTPGTVFVESYSAVVDLGGNRLPRAPKYKAALGVSYHFQVGPGDLKLRADYAWQDDVYFTVYNIPTASQEAYGTLKARATWRPDDGDWSVTLFGDNLTDEKALTNGILTGQVYGGIVIGNMIPPRTVGVEVSMKFR
jgi:iron complex outermembrane recepter protein